MSFHEKSAWVSLLSITVVFVPYFLAVFQYPLAFIGFLVVAVIILVAMLTGFHIVNAVMTASIRKRGDTPAQDEMERLIELRAAKFSGFVLAFVVVAWYINVSAFGVSALGSSPSEFSIPVLSVLTAMHVLFAGFVISNLGYYGAIIAGYRKLTHG